MSTKRVPYHALETEEEKLVFRQLAVSSYVSGGTMEDPATWPGYQFCDWEGMMRARETFLLSIFCPRLARWFFGD